MLTSAFRVDVVPVRQSPALITSIRVILNRSLIDYSLTYIVIIFRRLAGQIQKEP